MAGDGKVGYADGFKTCTGCGQRKSVSEFPWHPDKRLKRGGTYRARCVPCGDRPKTPELIRQDKRKSTVTGEEYGSALDLADPDTYRQALRREAEYRIDIAFMEQWAAEGFAAISPVL